MAGLDAHGASTLIRRSSLSEQGRAIAVITHIWISPFACARAPLFSVKDASSPTDPPKTSWTIPLLKRAGLAEPACAKARQWLRRVPSC